MQEVLSCKNVDTVNVATVNVAKLNGGAMASTG